MKLSEMNAREQLDACETWLSWHDERLSQGLKSAEDALKLWRYFMQGDDLPEMCDEEVDHMNVADARILALGYDPLEAT